MRSGNGSGKGNTAEARPGSGFQVAKQASHSHLIQYSILHRRKQVFAAMAGLEHWCEYHSELLGLVAFEEIAPALCTSTWWMRKNVCSDCLELRPVAIITGHY